MWKNVANSELFILTLNDKHVLYITPKNSITLNYTAI